MIRLGLGTMMRKITTNGKRGETHQKSDAELRVNYVAARGIHNVPSMLKSFRFLHKQNKTQMVQLLWRYGVIGVNWSTYYRWESGEQTPRGLSTKAIEKALDKADEVYDTRQDTQF